MSGAGVVIERPDHMRHDHEDDLIRDLLILLRAEHVLKTRNLAKPRPSGDRLQKLILIESSQNTDLSILHAHDLLSLLLAEDRFGHAAYGLSSRLR